MSIQPQTQSKTTVRQVIVALIGAFAAPILAIVLIVQLVLSIQASHIDEDDPAHAEAAVRERIEPVAQVEAVDPNAPRVERSGEAVYQAVCTSCHQGGALGAPKFGNKADWAPRIAKGYDHLLEDAIKGIGQMPPRGGDSSISDVEMARAVAYMANAAGANFKPKE